MEYYKNLRHLIRQVLHCLIRHQSHSKPLIDVNDPDYVDYNGDNQWQAPDEVYQGRACVQSLIDAGHCNDQTIPVCNTLNLHLVGWVMAFLLHS